MAHTDRVVVLVDMDCFYCQVEEKLDPKLEGKPIAVVQYNAWRGGGIIAVNYPAREQGVTRHMRGDQAKQKCHDIVLARVPEVRGKADLTKYRDAGKKVAEVLQTSTNILEKASIDEAYLDITEEVKKRLEWGLDQIQISKLTNTFVVGCDTKSFITSLKENIEFSESNIKLAIGGIITEEIRAEILKKTGYKCSAGIAHNKVLAKLVCGLHKPNKQTLLPQNAISELYKDLPIRKIKSLGGKFGSTLSEELQISFMGELVKFTEKELAKKFDEKIAKWLYNIARGIDLEPVTVRLVSKSIGCCKRFPGKTSLITPNDVEHWINELASEISERLEKDLKENNRRAKQMVVSFTQEANDRDLSSSRTHPLQSYEQAKIARSALDVIRRFCLRADGNYCITFLGLSVGNFQDLKNSVDISSLFKNMNQTKSQDPQILLQDYKPSNLTFFQKDAIPTKNATNGSKTKENSFLASNGKSKTSFIHSWAANHSVTKSDFPTQSKAEVESALDAENLFDSDASGPLWKECGVKSEVLNKQSFVFSKINLDNNLERRRTTTEGEKINRHISPTREVKTNNSFFLNYFMNEGKNLLETTPKNVDPRATIDAHKQIEILQDVASLERQNEINPNNGKEVCPECNKKIIPSEYLSHLDYHFALRMVKDEAHLYTEPRNNAEKYVNGQKNEIKCRDLNKCGRMTSILQKGKKEKVADTAEISKGKYPRLLGLQQMEFSDGETFEDQKISKYINQIGSSLVHENIEINSSKKNNNDYDIYDSTSLTTDIKKMDLKESILDGGASTSGILDHFDEDLFSNEGETTNLSVYSADTEELNEDTKSLIYFEDVFSESDSSQPLFKIQEQNTSDNKNILEGKSKRISCLKEIFSESDSNGQLFHEQEEEKSTCTKLCVKTDVEEELNDPLECTSGTTKSFFINYLIKEREREVLRKMDGEERNKSEHCTVKVQEETFLQYNQQEMVDLPECSNISTHCESFQKQDQPVCPECNRIVPSSEFVSHLDHHLVLKMVKDEAHLYKNIASCSEEKSPKPGKKKPARSSKRKLPESKILMFLQRNKSEDLDENNSEICTECHKRIKLDDTAGHADYHAAKKLHSELNWPKIVARSSVTVKGKNNKSVKNLSNISNFFKVV